VSTCAASGDSAPPAAQGHVAARDPPPEPGQGENDSAGARGLPDPLGGRCQRSLVIDKDVLDISRVRQREMLPRLLGQLALT
jgi:hypothetical protein